MKFLIAGFGSIGKRHFENLLHLGESDIVFYRTHKSSLQTQELGDFPVETDLHDALRHNPDAVVISNPTALHLDIAIPSARRGCHLLIEKPLSHTMDNVDTLRKIVDNKHVQVLMGFQFRFHPALKKIKSIIWEGEIGKPLSVRAHWGEYLPDWHPWEDYRKSYSARRDLGGGVILTLCHPIDYLRWLFGEIKEITSIVGYQSDLEIEVEDTAEIGFRFESGVIGSVHLNYTQIPPRHSLEIVGTSGTLRWDYYHNEVKLFPFDDERTEKNEWQIILSDREFERNQLFLDEMKHFIEVVNGEASPVCRLEDGIRVLEIALQARA